MNRIIVASIFALALASALKTCYKGGCSGQLCSDQDGMISTCEWRESYGCYRTAKCEAQANGECAWTSTTEL
jgi:eight-cysteine-cluster-containing protein